MIAVYAGYEYDSTFGKIAAFSPSYGYAASSMERLASDRGRPPLLKRFYQDTGYPDDNWILDMEAIALSQGFVLGVDFMSVSAPGGEHSSASWEHRFPAMLRFMFPRQ